MMRARLLRFTGWHPFNKGKGFLADQYDVAVSPEFIRSVL